MSDVGSVRRVTAEYTVVGANHAEIVKRATEVWRAYVGNETMSLPFDTEISVSPAETTTTGAGEQISISGWQADVVVRTRGDQAH